MEEIWLKPYVSQDFDPKAAAEARKAEMAGMNDLVCDLDSKDLKDFEKASAVFIVCAYFRHDTQDVSIDSVKEWAEGRDNVDLRSCLDVIRRTAADIISRVEDKMWKY